MAISVITAAGLQQLFREGGAIELIDVRSPAEFRGGHIQCARNVPLDQLDPASLAAVRCGSASDLLYFVCQSGGRGEKACEKFIRAGFTNVVNIEGGMKACMEAGLPVVAQSRKVISLERQIRIAAGSLVLLGVLLGWFLHPGFVGISAFVGAGLIFAGITDFCGLGLLLARMPWNR
jgi:rhodanese-related sulfurtransferase